MLAFVLVLFQLEGFGRFQFHYILACRYSLHLLVLVVHLRRSLALFLGHAELVRKLRRIFANVACSLLWVNFVLVVALLCSIAFQFGMLGVLVRFGRDACAT